jgi:outer membrane lipopolysaccharide assembly protein LptE/RlpB
MTHAIRSLRCLGLSLFVLVLAGCGYHLVGTATTLPDELQTLYLEPFENQTTQADMDQRLDEAIAQEWVSRGRFRLVGSKEAADVELRGIITRLGVAPVTFDERGRATEYQMTLQAEVRLYDLRGEEPKLLWEDTGFSRRTSYQVDISAVDYFDRQVEAMDALSKEFARALVTAVLEGF